MGRRITPLPKKCPKCGSSRTEAAGRVVGYHCKACGAVWRPREVSKESGGIPSTRAEMEATWAPVGRTGRPTSTAAAASSAEELLGELGSGATGTAVDALRVLSLVKAIESRGEGHNLGQWCEMVMGWDAARVFDAVHHAVDAGWIEPNTDSRLLQVGEKGRAAR